MLIEEIDKYLKHVERIDTVNSIGIMDIDEIVEYITNGGSKELMLSNLDKEKRKKVEKLIEGDII
jgi:hypothetical protein